MSVCQVLLAGKPSKDILESLSSITDGDKVALLTMLNACKQNKSKKEVLAAAKTAAMQVSVKSYFISLVN